MLTTMSKFTGIAEHILARMWPRSRDSLNDRCNKAAKRASKISAEERSSLEHEHAEATDFGCLHGGCMRPRDIACSHHSIKIPSCLFS